MELVHPKLNEIEVVKEEDALLRCGFHLEVIVASLLIPAWFIYETRLLNVTKLENIVRGDGEFACIVVRYEDTLNWIDVDIALIAIELEPMDLIQAALHPLEWVESSIRGLQGLQICQELIQLDDCVKLLLDQLI